MMRSRLPHRRRQRGVATLAVVLVLFFVIALTAAYTSRNMIFEQKTSGNQYRSTLALEAAEAGIEWTLAMLNGGLINESCGNVDPTQSFQQRYLDIVDDADLANNGRIVNRGGRPTGASGNWPACAFDGVRWNNPLHCACPDDAAVVPAAPGGPDMRPAFRVWPAHPGQLSVRPGVIALQSAGCTKLATGGERCLDLDAQGDIGDGLATLRLLLALRSGLATPPAAAVTARGGITPAGAGFTRMRVINADQRTGGVTVDAGGIVDSEHFVAETLPGTPPETSVVGGDTRLSSLEETAPGGLTAGDRMFVAHFGMRRQTYREQPGLRRCPQPGVADCGAAEINALLDQHPGRVIWVDGDLTLDANVGTSAAPVLLVIDGTTLTLSSGVDIVGFVYLTGGAGGGNVEIELPAGATSIIGALVAETSLITSYTAAPGGELRVTYSPGVLNTLRTGYGSWVRIPGSWKDFRE